MLRNRRMSLWFWVALVAILTNKALVDLALNLLQQVLQAVGVHVGG